MRFDQRVTSAACLVALSGGAVRAGVEGLQRVASGLAAPIFVTAAPADPSRLFIAERGGQIRILDLTTGTLAATPFLSMSGIDTEGEGGFLGLAFHPNYSNEGMSGFGKFYVNVTTDGSPLTTRIREFQVSAGNPNLAEPGSLREILNFAQPQNNHNGGWIGFSPQDHYLYIASGDGGGGNDSGTGHTAGTGNAQDITNNLLGKMLRIDINGDDFPTDAARNYAIPPTNPFVGATGDDEIWSYGLRNPFRAGFDRQTGDLWIGDVGQSQREEIDFQPASSTGGENYGWRLREGLIQTPTVGGPKPTDNVDPVYDYNRDNDAFGGTVVTGGYVYRGPDPSLQGKYFFLDSRNSASTADDNYWMFDPANPFGTVMNIDEPMTPDLGSAQFPVSFGEDAFGNLYIAYIASGEVYRIATTIVSNGTWNSNANGNWSTFGNWLAGVPSAIGATARFGAIITAPRTVTVDAPQTVGTIEFDSSFSYTIGGAGAISMNVSTGQAGINVLLGSHTISAPIALHDDLTVNVIPADSTLALTGPLTATGRTITKSGAGTARLSSVIAGGLTIEAGTVQVLPSGGSAAASRVNGLGISQNGRLDLADNKLIVAGGNVGSWNGSAYTGVAGLVDSGRGSAGNALWDGSGIVTSDTRAIDNGDLVSIGVAKVSEVRSVTDTETTTFAGQTVQGADVIAMVTWGGDATLDGKINIDDYGRIDGNVGQSGSVFGWSRGDFNYDGKINIDDYGIIDGNINRQGAAFFAGGGGGASGIADVGAVPEPALAGSLTMLASGLLGRRRRSAWKA